MSKRVQHIGFSAAGMAAVTGLQRELMVDTTNWVVVVHDGAKVGGYPLALASLANAQAATELVAGTMSAADKTKLDQYPAYTNPFLLSRGAVGAVAYGFNADASTGIYSPGAGQVAIANNGTQRVLIDNTGNITLTGPSLVLSGSDFLSFGTNPAGSGEVRSPNNSSINFRNAANSADIVGLLVDGANIVYVGDDVNPPTVKLRASNSVTVRINGADVLSFSAPAANKIGQVFGCSGAAAYGLINTPEPIGSTRNLKINNASATTLTVVADEIVVGTALGGTTMKISGLNVTLNIATVGVNGMDTGAASASADLSLYAILNPSTGASGVLAVLGATSNGTIYSGVNLPAGYTMSALIGSYKMNGSAQFGNFIQFDRTLWIPSVSVASGLTATAFTNISIASLVPANTKIAFGTGSAQQNSQLTVASDATQALGQCSIGAFSTGVVGEGNWSVPLRVAQNIAYILSAGGASTANLSLSGYTF